MQTRTCFQKVIEFRKRSFWSSQIDLAALNEKIQSLNDEGWLVRSITTSSSLIGGVSAYTLLIELKDEEQGRKVAE